MGERDEYKEWLGKLQKWGSKPYRLGHCLGARDAFHWVRKNKWKALDGKPCDKLLYGKVISTVNQCLREMLLEGHQIEFPYQMGTILLSCYPAKIWESDGEYKTNYKVDWKKTLQYLWEDKEAMDNHPRIKRIEPRIYRVRYTKRKAHFQNRYFYLFRANRSLNRTLGRVSANQKIIAEHTLY